MRRPGRFATPATLMIILVGSGAGVTTACQGIATSLGGRPGPEAGLLRGKSPVRSHGVTHLDRLTDGIAAPLDDPPRTDVTSLLASPEAFAIYDLGDETRVGCAAIVADGDDRYTLALSHDGQSFTPLWSAAARPEPGMQPRVGRDLDGAGRYLRLSASGGDGSYAVAELSVAALCPPRWPPALALQSGTPLESSARLKLWVFAATAVAFILGYRRRLPDFVKLLVSVPVGLAIALAVQLSEMWPLSAPLARALVLALLLVGLAAAARAIARRRRRRLGAGAVSSR